MSNKPFSSQLIADVGISMGDEGKGRLVWEIINELKSTTGLEDPVRVVLKVNGGANSGHTVGGLKLNVIPGGVAEDSVRTLALGLGVVADPRKILWEMVPLERRGYRVRDRLAIDMRTQVSDVSHRLLDLAWENYRTHVLNEQPRGSTGRGISPAYADEVGQWQIFYSDFLGSKDSFAKKMRERLARTVKTVRYVCEVSEDNWDGFFTALENMEERAHLSVIQGGDFDLSAFSFTQFKGKDPFSLNQDSIIDAYWLAGRQLVDSIVDVRELVLHALYQERFVIGEFGQSYWLDKRHGFTPYVTASHTYTPEFFESAGIPVQPIHTIAACKAYDTKVGTHAFLTAMPEAHPLASRLRGLEFGTSTGRQRSVGWFDAVEKGEALRYGGFQDLVINKLDVLAYGDDWQGGELLVCTAYADADGNQYHHVPREDGLRMRLRPVYKQLRGWSEDIASVRYFDDLPEAAKDYIAYLMHAIIAVAGRHEPRSMVYPNLRLIGVGPEPSQVIRDVPSTESLLVRARNL
jgi:adenylosuccinate synthase